MVAPLRRAIFFDRDGVLNKAIVKNGKPYPPLKISELVVNSEAANVIQFFKNRNFLCIVITNQPDVGRRKVKKKIVNQINFILKKKIKFDDIYTCFHRNNYSFDKKPMPGMILKAKKKWKINLSKSYMVGDRYKDILAGLNSSLTTIYLKSDYKNDKKPKFYHYKVNSLKEVIGKVKYD